MNKNIQKNYKQKDTNLFLDNERKYVLRIRDMPIEQKPREKLIKYGPSTLSSAELLAIILNTGNKNEDVIEVSNRIIKDYGEKSVISQKNVNKMSKDLNISIIKSSKIIACGELGRRFYEKHENGFTTIRTARDTYEYLQDMRNLPKEHLRGLYLNSHNLIIHDEVISIGTINSNIVHPREVFRPAIEYNAVAIVLAHNHPSNISTPSKQDIEITKQLVQAGKMIGINILDHVIITKDNFISIHAGY
jgi:DNA repair protein RadC